MEKLMAISYKKFQKKHQCQFCFYYQMSKTCFFRAICYIDLLNQPVRKKRTIQKCSKDIVGSCPYANQNGTCFGFCLQNILIDYRERKNKHVQSEAKKDEYSIR